MPYPLPNRPHHASVKFTPAWRRPLVLLGLALFAGYYAECFQAALRKPGPPPALVRQWPWLGWFAFWICLSIRDRIRDRP